MVDKQKVIVVDDVPAFTRTLKDLLSYEGINIKVYEEPEEFLKFAQDLKIYDSKVLVVDYSMPKLNGFDVFKELNEICKGNLDFKMVLYSANLEQIALSEKEFLQSIGVELLKKPNISKLFSIIEDNVEGKE